jgi:hypothetical protein
MHASADVNSSWVMVPARTASLNLHTSVPDPTSRPRYLPFSIGPPVSMIVGRSTLAAPIKSAGVVLSHPPSSTTASIGLARIDSSTSMLIKFRYTIAVGLISGSPSEMVGNSKGTPPASHTPRFTCSAIARR